METDSVSYDGDGNKRFSMEYVIEEITNWQVDYSELTTDYLTGEECGTIEGLPADAKEVTWEQYMNNEF